MNTAFSVQKRVEVGQLTRRTVRWQQSVSTPSSLAQLSHPLEPLLAGDTADAEVRAPSAGKPELSESPCVDLQQVQGQLCILLP